MKWLKLFHLIRISKRFISIAFWNSTFQHGNRFEFKGIQMNFAYLELQAEPKALIILTSKHVSAYRCFIKNVRSLSFGFVLYQDKIGIFKSFSWNQWETHPEIASCSVLRTLTCYAVGTGSAPGFARFRAGNLVLGVLCARRVLWLPGYWVCFFLLEILHFV